MKYLGLIWLIFLSQFTNGQNARRVFTTYQNVAVFDDFSYVTDRWDQKKTGSESLIISENVYTIQRIKDSYFTVSLARDIPALSDYEMIASIEVERDKSNKEASGGLIFNAQSSGNGALILEINNKKQFRISVLNNGHKTAMFGDKNGGWQKSKYLNKKGINEIRLVTQGNEYDLYFNDVYERSFIQTSFSSGKVGFFADARSTMLARLFIIKINGQLDETPAKKKEEVSETTSGGDDTYVELVKVFRDKIDKQQAEIAKLTEDLNICKANLSIDTASVSKVKVLKEENIKLKEDLKKLESDVEQAKKRLAYLESMKEDIESQTNGDLIIHLTELLAKEKEKNKKLTAEKQELQKEVGELRRRN